MGCSESNFKICNWIWGIHQCERTQFDWPNKCNILEKWKAGIGNISYQDVLILCFSCQLLLLSTNVCHPFHCEVSMTSEVKEHINSKSEEDLECSFSDILFTKAKIEVYGDVQFLVHHPSLCQNTLVTLHWVQGVFFPLLKMQLFLHRSDQHKGKKKNITHSTDLFARCLHGVMAWCAQIQRRVKWCVINGRWAGHRPNSRQLSQSCIRQ